MATFTVTNLDDSGSGSLRQAIRDANALAGADLITFAPGLSGQAITLTSGELAITDALTIDGDLDDDGTPDITVERGAIAPNFRIFNVDDGDSLAEAKAVTLDGLTITGGRTTGELEGGGGIRSQENLTILNSAVSGNTTTGENSDGGGIYANGELAIIDSVISGNKTIGDRSGGAGIAAYESNLTVNNSTISNNSNLGLGSGGGILIGYDFSSDLIIPTTTITDSIISGNTTTGSGGGILNSHGYMTVSNTLVSNNVSRSYGGGIKNDGVLTVNDSTISGNFSGDQENSRSTEGNGGGIANTNGDFTVNNSVISGNATTAEGSGGGTFSRDGNFTISNSTISGNTSGGGGGIWGNFGIQIVTNSTISDNFASNGGGGIGSTDGILIVNNSTISSNATEGSGGGITSNTYEGGPALISNSTVSGNRTAEYGGGIFNIRGVQQIRNSTITNNQGGGLASSGDITPPDGPYVETKVVSSIIVGNADSDVDFFRGAVNPFISQGNNLIGTGNALDAFDQPSDITEVANTGLEPLADNGGPTQTHALQPDSPAIDAGSNPQDLPTDQRGEGFTRVVGDQADIGAFELGAGLDLELLINSADADTAMGAIALAPGEAIAWTYQITNTGREAFTFAEVVLVDDQGLEPMFDASSDEGSDGLLSPGETWLYTASGLAEDLGVLIDFDTDAAGSPLTAGTLVDNQYSDFSLTVSTPGHSFGAMIFDSANPTGGDLDLGTPHQDFGGPGQGQGGEDDRPGENGQALNNVLILSEDGNSLDPDDDAQGGQLLFDWGDNLVRVHTVGILDADTDEAGGTVVSLDEQGNVLETHPIPPLGGNSYQQVNVGADLVSQLQVNLVGSGAITELSFTRYERNVATVSARNLSVTDTSYYTNGLS